MKTLFLTDENLKSDQKFNPSSICKGLNSESFKQLCGAKVAYFNGVKIKDRFGECPTRCEAA